MVGAGLCSARQNTVILCRFMANSYAPTALIVGADAHIDPFGSHEFAEDSRKTGTFCGRTESSAPTVYRGLEPRCRGRRLCRPIGQLRIRRRFSYKTVRPAGSMWASTPTHAVRTASELLSCFKLRGKRPEKPKRFFWSVQGDPEGNRNPSGLVFLVKQKKMLNRSHRF